MNNNKNTEKEEKKSNLDYIKDRIEAREEISVRKVKKRMPALGKLAIALAILGVVIIGVIIALDHVKPDPNPKPEPPVIVITEEKLSKIQELSTAKYTYIETQSYDDWRELPFSFKIPFTKKSIELQCKGEIKVSYNMKKCEIKSTSGRVTVILPKSTISHNLDSTAIKEENNIFNPISLKDQDQMEDDLKIIMENRAIEKGMLDKAKESAKETIYNLIEQTLNDGQVLDVYQSSAAIQADQQYIKDTTEKAKELINKYKISNINE